MTTETWEDRCPNVLALGRVMHAGLPVPPALKEAARGEMLREVDALHDECKAKGDRDGMARCRLMRLGWTGQITETEYDAWMAQWPAPDQS